MWSLVPVSPPRVPDGRRTVGPGGPVLVCFSLPASRLGCGIREAAPARTVRGGEPWWASPLVLEDTPRRRARPAPCRPMLARWVQGCRGASCCSAAPPAARRCCSRRARSAARATQAGVRPADRRSSAPGSPASSCAYRLHRRGVACVDLRGQPGADRRALLDRARVRRRPDGRARRRVHRLAPPAHAGAGEASSASSSSISTRSPNPGSPRLWLNGARRYRSQHASERGGSSSGGSRRPRRRVGTYGYADATAGGARLRRALGRRLARSRTSRRRQPQPLGPAACGPRWRASSASTPTGSAR